MVIGVVAAAAILAAGLTVFLKRRRREDRRSTRKQKVQEADSTEVKQTVWAVVRGQNRPRELDPGNAVFELPADHNRNI